MSPRVLLLGGHGKVSMLMTPLMLSRSWQVTSVVRNPDHEGEIKATAKGQPGEVDVFVSSLEDIKDVQQAQSIIDKTKPDFVVWSAGAGGKGGAERTFAIDRDAAKYFIQASIRTPSIKKFLMVSYIGSRRNRPHWFSDEDWAYTQKTNNGALSNYFAAKVEADECLTALAKQRGDPFHGIVLRPGQLTDDAPSGKISLGHTKASGKITRADVADVAVRLIERDDTKGYYDLLNGEEDAGNAVERVAKEKVDCFEGEDEERIMKAFKL